jgi:protein-S-isoprenylcysteine O-methyltransferase Ste14
MYDENTYRYFAIVVFILAMSISITFRSRAERSGDRISAVQEEGRLLSTIRSFFGLVLWGSALVYLINPGWMAWAQIELPAWMRWTGGFLMLLCIPLIYWVFSSLGKNVTQTVAIRKDHNLVRSGPYRWVRHPLYTVGLLLFLSFSLLSANWFTALVILATFKILSLRTNLEESRLAEKFGDDYRRYMQSTGRYFPRVKRLFGGSRS